MVQRVFVAKWRDSSRSPKFYGIDGTAVFPILLFLLHIKMWTLIVAIFGIVFFSVLRSYGFKLSIFFRWLRNILAGNRKRSSLGVGPIA